MKKTMIALMASMISSVLLASPVFADSHKNDTHHEAHHKDHHKGKKHHCGCDKASNIVYKLGKLGLSDAFIRPTAMANAASAAYITINNMGDMDDKLISVQSDIAESVEIHDTNLDEKGVMKMLPINLGLALKANTVTSLKPRVMHIMLHNISEPLMKHGAVPLKLNFEKSGSRMISFAVKDHGAKEQCKHECKHNKSEGHKDHEMHKDNADHAKHHDHKEHEMHKNH
jgi:copper(I)-binding protein